MSDGWCMRADPSTDSGQVAEGWCKRTQLTLVRYVRYVRWGSSDCSQRLLRGLDFGVFRRGLGRFWRVLGRKWGRIEAFWGQNRGQNGGDFGTILPGFWLFGDKKVWLAVTLWLHAIRYLLLITSIFGRRCVISVMCHECQEGISIWEAGKIRLIVNINIIYIILWPIFAHRKKVYDTFDTWHLWHTKKFFEKSCSKILDRNVAVVSLHRIWKSRASQTVVRLSSEA